MLTSILLGTIESNAGEYLYPICIAIFGQPKGKVLRI